MMYNIYVQDDVKAVQVNPPAMLLLGRGNSMECDDTPHVKVFGEEIPLRYGPVLLGFRKKQLSPLYVDSQGSAGFSLIFYFNDTVHVAAHWKDENIWQTQHGWIPLYLGHEDFEPLFSSIYGRGIQIRVEEMHNTRKHMTASTLDDFLRQQSSPVININFPTTWNDDRLKEYVMITTESAEYRLEQNVFTLADCDTLLHLLDNAKTYHNKQNVFSRPSASQRLDNIIRPRIIDYRHQH